MATEKPHRLTFRAYQVGFGDCFLLTFHYRKLGDRHVLIDCGSTGAPRGFGDITDVAASICEETGGKLHAVVATHRHKDHISGFTRREDGTGPGDLLRSCNPDVVILPWTEAPDAAPDALAAPPLPDRSRAFLHSLADMHAVAGSVVREAARLADGPLAVEELVPEEPAEEGGEAETGEHAEPSTGRRRVSPVLKRLAFMGENNLPNRSAVENLMTMGRRRVYVSCGSRSGLERVLPGVKVRVLGPPTLEQTESIRRQRHRDESEFWHLQALASRRAANPSAEPLFPEAPVLEGKQRPKWSRWLLRRLRSIRVEQLREIVRVLDKAMNNTSVILLFEAGRQNLLFPGDAQIESWEYALSQRRFRNALQDVTFYKVGHHGSLNATPKSLWEGFTRKSRRPLPNRLRTVVSTMPGKHGDTRRSTEVPRKTLLEALETESNLFSTQEIKARDEKPFWSVTLEL